MATNTSTLLKYLSHGVTPSEAARALGVTPSAITQALSTPAMAAKVADLEATKNKDSQHLDAKYDDLESILLDKLKATVPLLLKPREISDVLSKINAAKRRGITATNNDTPAPVVHLHLPPQIQNKFVLNGANQVVAVGEQQLITMQSANMAKLAAGATNENTDQYGFPTSTKIDATKG